MACYSRMARVPLLWRIPLFLAILLLFWMPWAVCIYALGRLWDQSDIANSFAIAVLYSLFIGCAWFWGRWVHGWQQPFINYGLVFCRGFITHTLVTLVVGFGLVWCLFGIEVLFGWARVHPGSLTPIVLEGLMVGLGIGFAEELLFRGWLLAELRTGLSRSQAIVWSSGIFALAHFIKPWSEVLRTSPQFLGLLLLGIVLATLRYISRLNSQRPLISLGLPIGLHAGLVWGYYIVDVGDLVTPLGVVPEWVTGIHGNPLSGVLGVMILAILTGLVCLKLRLE